jgi:hypothetical protein
MRTERTAGLAFVALLAAAGTGCLGNGLIVRPDPAPHVASLRISPRVAIPATQAKLFVKGASPLSYQPAASFEVEGLEKLEPVRAEACQWSLFLGPVGIFGAIMLEDASYQAAYQRAMTRSGADVLYDVRVDSKVLSVLGIYTRLCTVLEAGAARATTRL